MLLISNVEGFSILVGLSVDTLGNVEHTNYHALNNRFSIVSDDFDSLVWTVTLDKIKATSLQSANEIFVLYPNPCKDYLNISLENSFFSYKIFSIEGKLLNSNNNSFSSDQIDISTYKEGLYIIELKSGVKKKIMYFEVKY